MSVDEVSRKDEDSVWIPLSKLAKEFEKSRVTIHNWCVDGFLLTLGYRIRRDCKGHWTVSKNPEKL